MFDGESYLSFKYKKAAEADELDAKSYEERFCELVNPKYISVVGMPETFGGSQMWFNKFYQKYGCGVVAMNDVLMYLNRSTGKQSSRPIEVNVEDYMWSFIRSANSVNVHGPLAALGTDIAVSMDIYFATNDMPYFATWTSGSKDTLEAINEMVGNDIPAIISVGPDVLGEQGIDNIPFYQKDANGRFIQPTIGDKKIQGHYMVVTGVEPSINGYMLKVSTWGQEKYINYDELEEYSSKHFGGKILSNVVYIRPTED